MGASESTIVLGTTEVPKERMSFVKAVVSGNLPNVKKTLNKNVDINKKYQLGQTALFYASLKDYDQMVEYLIQMGANMAIGNDNGSLPIHIAAWNGHVKVLRVLIKHNADVHVKNKNGLSPFDVSIIRGHLDAATLLVKYVSDIDGLDNDLKLIQRIAYKGDLKMIDFLVSNGANVNVQGTKLQNYPINSAAWFGHYKVVSYLIDHGADASSKGHLEMTPLYMAALRNHIDTVKVLIDAGADLEARTKKYQQLPLHATAFKGHTDILMLLINSGSNIDGVDINGLTILHTAVYHGHIECVKFLLRSGADKSIKTKKGTLPYGMAKTAEMKQLLENGPDSFTDNVVPSAPILEESLYIGPNQASVRKLESVLNLKVNELHELRATCSDVEQDIDGLKNEIELLKQGTEEKVVPENNLECPICFEIPRSPLKVFQCNEGHIFCETCSKRGITHCPECRVPLGNTLIRNRRLEEIIKDLS